MEECEQQVCKYFDTLFIGSVGSTKEPDRETSHSGSMFIILVLVVEVVSYFIFMIYTDKP